MTKQELLKRINELFPEESRINCITDSEYAVIEKVHNFHPSISETGGWNQIAELYVKFGMAIINDMVPRAEAMQALERKLAVVESSMGILKHGGWVEI